MQKQLLQVGLFMALFRQSVHQAPVLAIDYKTWELRRDLTKEETKEFFEDSFIDPDVNGNMVVDHVEALDALCDRLYVLLGDVHTIGMGWVFPAAFRRVHESNMTKLWTGDEVDMASRTATNLTFECVGDAEHKSNRAYIARNQLGKVIKSPSYEPANLRGFLEELEGQEQLDFNKVEHLTFGDAPEPDLDELLELFGKETDDEED